VKVTKVLRDDDGNMAFSVFATESETAVLINIALEALVAIGRIPDNVEEGYEFDLANFPVEDMFKA
jgi:hypothetical protein